MPTNPNPPLVPGASPPPGNPPAPASQAPASPPPVTPVPASPAPEDPLAPPAPEDPLAPPAPAPPAPAQSVQSKIGGGMEKANTIFTLISVLVGVSLCIVIVPCFFIALSDLLRLRKGLKTESTRVQNGEKVVIYESVLYRILKYAEYDRSSGNTKTEPFNIYVYLVFAKLVFSFANFAIFVLIANFAIKIALSIEGSTFGSEDGDKRLMKGFILSLYVAIVMIIYVKVIYKRLFEDSIFVEIQNRYNSLVDLDTLIYNNMLTPSTTDSTQIQITTDFYNRIQTDDIQAIVNDIENITSPTILVQQIVTLNIYEYFKKNLPNFGSSPIKTQMFTLEGVRNRTIRPSLYLRIDCTNPIVNIYHVLDIDQKIDPESRESIETQLSMAMSQLNQNIAKVKLEAQPILSLFRNYLRTITTYFLIVFFLTILIVMKMFDIQYEGSFLQKVISWIVDIPNKIMRLFGKKN